MSGTRRRLFGWAIGLVALIGAPAHGEDPKFDVVSVKANHDTVPSTSNFPLGPGDVYVRNGGHFSAKGFPLSLYISFAYKMLGNQVQYLAPQMPEWTKFDRFDIEARAAEDPGKDGMRMMMRALLADRFKLALRFEKREVPVMAFVLAKSGKLGPQLHVHADDGTCPTVQPDASTPGVVKGTPQFCNGIFNMPPSAPGLLRFGGRNVTLSFIADTFSAGAGFDRPFLDATGLGGTFDFTLEFVPPQPNQGPIGAAGDSDPAGPTFVEALRDQLGIKLQSQKGMVSVPVLDHVERPAEN
jgi:uncharacterized protein (TIGR03435 family)